MKKTNLNRKKVILACILLVFSVFMAAVFAGVMRDEFKQCVKDIIYGRGGSFQEKHYDITQVEAFNFLIEGNNFDTLPGESYIVISDINDYVQNLCLDFLTPLDDTVNFTIYFTETPGVFPEDQFFVRRADAGDVQGKFIISRNVSQLKIVIAEETSTHIALNSIIVNDGIEPLSIMRLAGSIWGNMGEGAWGTRFSVALLVCVFFSLHFLVDVNRMYNLIFDKRWLVAGLILLYMVCNRFHGDSIGMYDYYIQPNKGSVYVDPIFGQARAIRSDEWMVDTPSYLSTIYLDNPYGHYNNILRGTDTINNNEMGFYSLAAPVGLVRVLITKLFGIEYAFSFNNCVTFLLAFLFQLELFLIISDGKRLLSACGASMVTLSSWFMWLSMPFIITASSAALVCAYYYVNKKEWKYKIPFAIGTAIFTASFVMILYPAWQVPMGYIALAILVWMIHESWDTIKKMGKMEWIGIILSFVFCVSLVVSYLLGRREYMEAITSTEYPGGRVEYGGFAVYKLFNYIPGLLFAYIPYANPSEAGSVIGFFPVPMLMALYLWLRSKKKDWLVAGLLSISAFLLVYTTIGFPPILAQCTLMTYTTASRAVDLLGYIQVVLFVLIFSKYTPEEHLSKKTGIIIAVITGVLSVVIANHYVPDYMGRIFMLFSIVIVAFVAYVCVSHTTKSMQAKAFVTVILFSLLTGFIVRPLAKGLDAIYSKPAAVAITDIVEKNKDAKWIAYGDYPVPAFSIACGAPTINSVNTYPNMELWRSLDEAGTYNEVYNRYAHVIVGFTEEDTSMELLQTDVMQLNLSYKDIVKTDAEYIFSTVALSADNEYVAFEELYNEAGSHIYHISYKQ